MEVCAEGGVIVQQLARRITEDGGAALIADYGHDGTKTDTFRVRRTLLGTPAQSNAAALATLYLSDCKYSACFSCILENVVYYMLILQ